MDKFRYYLIISQLSIFILLSICSLMIPSVARSNGGVSNFGNYSSTVGLYSLGFSLCVLFLWLAADNILSKDLKFKKIAYVIFLIGLLYLLVLLSTFPRHLSFAYSMAHDYLGVALYVIEFFMSLWLIIKKHTSIGMLIFSIEIMGMLIGLLAILKFVHFLYVGQIIGSIGFGLLIIIYLPNVLINLLLKKTRLLKK